MTTQERLESSVRELAKIDARRQSATNTRDWTSLEGKIIRRELDEAEGKWLANSKTTATVRRPSSPLERSGEI